MKSAYILVFIVILLPSFSKAQEGWVKIGDMPQTRYAHTVNEINNKIYIVGGLHDENGVVPDTGLVYDRVTDT